MSDLTGSRFEPQTCVLSNFMGNRRVAEFSLSNCAQSFRKTSMCPKFCTNPVLKDIKCHISTNLSNFLKLCLLYCQKLFALAPINRRFAEKTRLSGNTGSELTLQRRMRYCWTMWPVFDWYALSLMIENLYFIVLLLSRLISDIKNLKTANVSTVN